MGASQNINMDQHLSIVNVRSHLPPTESVGGKLLPYVCKTAIFTRTNVVWPHPVPGCAAPTASAGQRGGSGAAKGFRFPLIHPKPNLQTILVQPEQAQGSP